MAIRCPNSSPAVSTILAVGRGVEVFFVRKVLGLFLFVVTTAYGQAVTHANTAPDGIGAAQDSSILAATSSDTEIRQRLQSEDPRLTAWGAHAVIEQKRSDLLPDLERILDRWEQARGQEPWDIDHLNAIRALLDAVIQMDGTLPAGTIQLAMDGERYGDLEAPLVLLLLRLPAKEAEPVWRKIIFTGDIRGGAQRVAADVLSRNPPPGFAARLIGGLTEFGQVTVAAPGVHMGRGSSPWGGYGCAGGLKNARTDWPKIGVYALLDISTKSGSALLVDGADPIYVTRLVITVDQYSQIYLCSSYGLTSFSGLTDERRLRIIGRLLDGSAGEMPLDLSPELYIEFRDEKRYRAQMDTFVHKQLAQFASVGQQLTERGLMTDDERRTATLHLQIAVSDWRKVREPSLPALDFGSAVSFVPAGN
jgi:hypothetical protein